MFDIQYLILIIMAVNVIVFLLPMLGITNQGSLIANWAKDNRAIQNGEWYRLVTSGFLHADLMHIFFNMYSLYVMSDIVISILGNLLPSSYTALGFVLLYLLCGVTSSLASYWRNPNPSIGASGSVFGLFGFTFIFALLAGQMEIVQQMLFILAINVAIAFMPGSRLDNWGHIGGFVGGVIIGGVLTALRLFL